MAYTPTEWKNGDTITAEKLNNLENGVANEQVFCFNIGWDDNLQKSVIDVPFSDLEDAWRANKIIMAPNYSTASFRAYDTPSGIAFFYSVTISSFTDEQTYMSIIQYTITPDGVVDSINKRVQFSTN